MRMKMNVVPALPVLQFRSSTVARLAILARSPSHCPLRLRASGMGATLHGVRLR
jgi:hypothetical protein